MSADTAANAAPLSPPGQAAPPPWRRAWEWLIDLLPHPLPKILRPIPAFWGALVVGGVMGLMLLPLACVVALKLVTGGVEMLGGRDLAGQIHQWVAGYIREGYAIEQSIARKGTEVEKQAATHTDSRMKKNNESLDYAQLVEFRLSRTSLAKRIPLPLFLDQHADIRVLSVRYEPADIQAPNSPTLAPAPCDAIDVSFGDVLQLLVDDIELKPIGNMKVGGDHLDGYRRLNAAWWNSQRASIVARSGGTEGPQTGYLVLRPASALLGSVHKGCAVIEVELALEVKKRELTP